MSAEQARPTFSEQLTAAAIQSPTVQNVVAAQAKKSFFSSMGFADDSQNAAANYPPQQYDESVIEDLDDEELQVIKKWAYNLRVAMIVVSTLCVITSWYNLATASNSVANNFLAVYVFFFSMIVCCYELAIRQITFIIVQNFGFMYNPVGRSIFLIFVAILLFQLSTMGQVMFAILLAVGIVQIYVDCRHPKFEKYKRTLHYYNRASAQYPSAAAKAAAMAAYAPPQPAQYAPGTGMYAQFTSDQYSQVPSSATAQNGAVMSV